MKKILTILSLLISQCINAQILQLVTHNDINTGQQYANLIVNGGFEISAPSFTSGLNYVNPYCAFPPAVTLPGWTIDGGGWATYMQVYHTGDSENADDPVEGVHDLYMGAGAYTYLSGSNGRATINADGTIQWPAGTTINNDQYEYAANGLPYIEQTIPTVIGEAYQLSFWLSFEAYHIPGTTQTVDGFLRITIGSITKDIITGSHGDLSGNGSSEWWKFIFTATSSSTIIRFTNPGHLVWNNGNNDKIYPYIMNGFNYQMTSEPVIDDVTVVPVSILPIDISIDSLIEHNNRFYYSANKIIIERKYRSSGELVIYNLSGQILSRQKLSIYGRQLIPFHYPKGFYVAKFMDESLKFITN